MEDKIYYVAVGSRGSKLVRDKFGKKKLRLSDGSLSDLTIPKWSYSEGNTTNLQTANNLSQLPKDTPIAIVLGLSNILAIDFDNSLFDKALELNHNCKNIAKSVGKDGGHFLYKYTQNDLTEYINNANGKKQMQLDTLYGRCLLFINNEANETKETLAFENELTECPLDMQYFLIAHYARTSTTSALSPVTPQQKVYGTKLGFFIEPILQDTKDGKEIDSKLLDHFLKIVTPKKYKDAMELASQVTDLTKPIETKTYNPNVLYHPDKLPHTESAHMYIVSISGALMVDISVSKEALVFMVNYLNNLFSSPLEQERIDTIITRDLNSDKFSYNPNWKKLGFMKYNKDQELIEILSCIVDNQLLFIYYNHITQELNLFNSPTLLDHITGEFGTRPKKDDLLVQVQRVEYISRPDKPFGHNYDDKQFNTYKWSQEQQVFYKPDAYFLTWSADERGLEYNSDHPRYPKVTIAALRNALGDKLDMFLSFMKRKYTTREYSPLIFVLYGVPHSFKSAIVNGVFKNLSNHRTKKLTYESLLEKYNSWQINTDLVLIDEVHYILGGQQQQLIKQLNDISGSNVITGVRRMYADVLDTTYPNELTFFLCTNEPLALSNETRDRRLVIFTSTKRASEALGMTDIAIRKAVEKESLDFAYFLSSAVKPLNDEDYISNENWKDTQYTDFVEQGYDNEDLLLKAIDIGDTEAIIERLKILGLDSQTIARSIELSKKTNTYYLRLKNSVESEASLPSIFTFTRVNMTKIDKKLGIVRNVKRRVCDYRAGQLLSNKKTIAILGTDLPQDLLEFINTL